MSFGIKINALFLFVCSIPVWAQNAKHNGTPQLLPLPSGDEGAAQVSKDSTQAFLSCLGTSIKNQKAYVNLKEISPAIESFIEAQKNNPSMTADKIAQMIELANYESHLDIDQVTAPSGKSYPDWKTARANKAEQWDHPSNFGIGNISPDRFVVRSAASMSAIYHTLGLPVPSELKTQKNLSQVLKSFPSSQLLKSKKIDLASQCNASRNKASDLNIISNSFDLIPEHIKSIAKMVARPSGAAMNSQEQQALDFLGSFLASCPRLNLEMMQNEFASGRPEKYYQTINNLELKKTPLQGICVQEIQALISKKEKSHTTAVAPAAPASTTTNKPTFRTNAALIPEAGEGKLQSEIAPESEDTASGEAQAPLSRTAPKPSWVTKSAALIPESGEGETQPQSEGDSGNAAPQKIQKSAVADMSTNDIIERTQNFADVKKYFPNENDQKEAIKRLQAVTEDKAHSKEFKHEAAISLYNIYDSMDGEVSIPLKKEMPRTKQEAASPNLTLSEIVSKSSSPEEVEANFHDRDDLEEAKNTLTSVVNDRVHSKESKKQAAEALKNIGAVLAKSEEEDVGQNETTISTPLDKLIADPKDHEKAATVLPKIPPRPNNVADTPVPDSNLIEEESGKAMQELEEVDLKLAGGQAAELSRIRNYVMQAYKNPKLVGFRVQDYADGIYSSLKMDTSTSEWSRNCPYTPPMSGNSRPNYYIDPKYVDPVHSACMAKIREARKVYYTQLQSELIDGTDPLKRDAFLKKVGQYTNELYAELRKTSKQFQIPGGAIPSNVKIPKSIYENLAKTALKMALFDELELSGNFRASRWGRPIDMNQDIVRKIYLPRFKAWTMNWNLTPETLKKLEDIEDKND